MVMIGLMAFLKWTHTIIKKIEVKLLVTLLAVFLYQFNYTVYNSNVSHLVPVNFADIVVVDCSIYLITPDNRYSSVINSNLLILTFHADNTVHCPLADFCHY
jgi:hypothetical protein